MNKLTSLFQKSVFGVALAAACAFASAAPVTYSVKLDTTSLAAGTYLDFAFTPSEGAARSFATVSKLTGGLTLAGFEGSGTSVGADSFTMSNDPVGFNYVDFAGMVNGMFGFDVTFDDGYLAGLADRSSLFAVSLLGSDFGPVTDGLGIVQFSLTANKGIEASIAAGFGSVGLAPAAAIPEPAALLLMLAGLGAMGAVARRRK